MMTSKIFKKLIIFKNKLKQSIIESPKIEFFVHKGC